MVWKDKIIEWRHHSLLFNRQQKAIETYECKKQQPLSTLCLTLLGVVVLCFGGMFFGVRYGNTLPNLGKIIGLGVLTSGCVGCIVYACRRERTLLLKSALFFTFLMIGGGIGLIAQLFNIPLGTPIGIILWAVLSSVVVLLSEQKFLSLLWMPLFFGGILGYWHLELLLLFFADSPLVTVCVTAGILLVVIWATGSFKHTFIRAVNRWAIALFYGVLFIGECGAKNHVVSFLVTIGFLCLIIWYAFRYQRIYLLGINFFLIMIQIVQLCLNLGDLSLTIGWWLFGTGLVVLIGVGIYRFINRQVNKP